MPPDQLPPEILRTVEEHRAMLRAVAAANGTLPLDAAQADVRRLNPAPAETVEEHVSRIAMRRFLGEPVDGPVIDPPLPLHKHRGDALALAWVAWSRNDENKVCEILASIAPLLLVIPLRDEPGMVSFTVYLWHRALTALTLGNLTTARTLWLRAIEVATTFGVDLNSVLRWTFAATFAHRLTSADSPEVSEVEPPQGSPERHAALELVSSRRVSPRSPRQAPPPSRPAS